MVCLDNKKTCLGYKNGKCISIENCMHQGDEIEDVLTIAYEGKYKNDISLLMVTRNNGSDMEILKVFTEEEADELYKKLTGTK